MGSSFLSEVDDTSILRTGALHRYHYPLTWLSASRLLLPRSGLERSDFVPWRLSDMTFVLDDVRSWGRSGNYLLFPSISHFDPFRTSCDCASAQVIRHWQWTPR